MKEGRRKVRLAVALLWMGISLLAQTCGEQVVWRFPGMTGRWLDPHNWWGKTSQTFHVPGPMDDVLLGETYSVPYGFTTVIIIESRGPPVVVNSVTLSNASFCLLLENFYNYNTSSGQWQVSSKFGDQCRVLLEIVPPTQLVVKGLLSMAYTSEIRMTSLSWKPSVKSSLSAGVWKLDGVLYGDGTVYGDLIGSGQMSLVRTYPQQGIAVIPQNAATCTIFGSLNTDMAINYFVNYVTQEHSLLVVKGNIFSAGNLGAINFRITYLGNYSSQVPYTLLTFENSSFASPPELVFLYSFGSWLQVKLCLTPATPIFGEASQCGESTDHTFGVLFNGNPYCLIMNTNCPGTPVCSARGSCLATGCQCDLGWAGFACELPLCPGSPRECSGNGECFAPQPFGSALPYCVCRKGWGGIDCSIPLCPNNCTDSEHGICEIRENSPRCICYAGYSLGPNLDCAVDTIECPGQFQECSGHGTCTDKNCTCDPGWEGPDCSLAVCKDACTHHGTCVAASNGSTKCDCDFGWTGDTCALPYCDDSQCSYPNGFCSPDLDPPRCICKSPTIAPTVQPPTPLQLADLGWTGANCSKPIGPACSLSDCEANGGQCSDWGNGQACLMDKCPFGFTDWDCSKYVCVNSGYPECNGHGRCELVYSSPMCICRAGYLPGADNACQFATCEIEGCSGRGKCRTDLAIPVCECEPYFYGPDCSKGRCPGSPTCSSQGVCSMNGTCSCTSEWQGVDCSVPVCPSTTGINCNSNGFCNSSSSPFVCQCYEGWSGVSCEIPVCPNQCSGHGYCDENLSPPACRCDPFFVGEDCHSLTSDEGSSQDALTISIATIVGTVMVFLALAGIFGTAIYFVWRSIRFHLLAPKNSSIAFDEQDL